jgi:excisionase family DNA binding protein
MAASPGNNVVVSARVLGLLADETRLRRLRVMYAADAQLRAELLVLSAVLLGSGDGTKVAVAASAPADLELLDTATAAQRAAVTARAIRKAISEHRLAATRVSGRWLIHPADLARYVLERAC